MKGMFLFLALTTLAAGLSGCNTVSGIGEDVSSVGGAVTNASEGAAAKM